MIYSSSSIGKKDTVKLLSAEDGGLVLYIKKLSRERFRLSKYRPGIKSFSMEWRDSVVMVEGIIENPDRRQRRVIASR
ncbi:IS66 family insertion sequence element accessory protein TnpB [Hallella multisaccharivorax]|uniref:IS66 family insertion sequence element accessory protein TnpB n=1 Tax=Hallella multisaccharivorax TaxID=310514 RepID=UPI001FD20808|nr:IS66 family insertion sequence element accessory protein TnpB [Hallella multisaccharivorax]